MLGDVKGYLCADSRYPVFAHFLLYVALSSPYNMPQLGSLSCDFQRAGEQK